MSSVFDKIVRLELDKGVATGELPCEDPGNFEIKIKITKFLILLMTY